MDTAALVIALLAAAFTGLQWREARESRRIAEKANKLAEKVETRMQREDDRAAVQWHPRLHPDYNRFVQFENVGTSTAYEVSFNANELAAVRVDRLSPDWRVEPRAFAQIAVKEPWDLADLPETLKIRYRRSEYGNDWQEEPVSLADLRTDLRRIAAEEYRKRVEEPIESDAAFRTQMEMYKAARAAADSQQSESTSQTPPATADSPSDVPEPLSVPADEPAPEQP